MTLTGFLGRGGGVQGISRDATSAQLHRCVTMGSVGADYRCPWCGRVGAGGYAMDPIGYPICVEGPFSCVWWQVVHRQLDAETFRAQQLGGILGRDVALRIPDLALLRIAAFLTP